jgi:hypothetical protein
MIMAFIKPITSRPVWQFLRGIPWQVWAALGALLLLFVAYSQGKGAGVAQERARQAQIEAQAVKQARLADEAARQEVTKGQDDVRQSNERAREAANAGDDPLRDGLRSLRADKAGASPATR